MKRRPFDAEFVDVCLRQGRALDHFEEARRAEPAQRARVAGRAVGSGSSGGRGWKRRAFVVVGG
jgi:hypothetical protein